MEKQKRTIFKGSAILGMGTFLAKLLGAIYRVPLTGLIGGSGLGLYQMIFPVYTVLLDFSGAGVPNALSKLVADKENKKDGYGYFVTALRFFALLGAVGSVVMTVFAKPFSKWQGNGEAYLGYIALAPAIFFVSLISCYRGFFQGKLNMFPTAISQIIEQTIKMLLGLFFVYLLVPDIKSAVAGATLAITVSEIVAFLQLYISLRRYKKKHSLLITLPNMQFRKYLKNIARYAIPVTLIGIILPVSQVIDSFLALNIIGSYSENATALYGLLSGVAMTVVNLPVAVCYGISAVAVPSVSGAKTDEEKERNAKKTMLLTFLVALPCAIFCYYLSPFIINLLFRSLSGSEEIIAVSILRLVSPTILFLSLVQTQNAIFIGKGKPFLPIITLLTGVVIKIIIETILFKNQKVNIYGGGIALIACYFFISLINLIIMTFQGSKNEVKGTFGKKHTVTE